MLNIDNYRVQNYTLQNLAERSAENLEQNNNAAPQFHEVKSDSLEISNGNKTGDSQVEDRPLLKNIINADIATESTEAEDFEFDENDDITTSSYWDRWKYHFRQNTWLQRKVQGGNLSGAASDDSAGWAYIVGAVAATIQAI